MKLKQFIEYCRDFTKEDFIKKHLVGERDEAKLIINDKKYLCPENVGFSIKSCNKSCMSCWLESLDSISFKDDKNVEDKYCISRDTLEELAKLSDRLGGIDSENIKHTFRALYPQSRYIEGWECTDEELLNDIKELRDKTDFLYRRFKNENILINKE